MNSWRLVSAWGSLRDGDQDSSDAAFHAGHINDVLRLSTPPYFPVLVASETSGVWLVNEGGGRALPLSDQWDEPNLNCLAQGIHGDQHVYAAGAALWESDTTLSAPLSNWRKIPVHAASRLLGKIILPGEIHRVVVLRELRRIVLASDNGVFWADIPAPGGNYNFRQATQLPGRRYSGLSQCAGNRVAAGAWGSDLQSHFGIFIGEWQPQPPGNLVFKRASIGGAIDEKLMLRTEVAACASDPSVLFAVCLGGGDLTGDPNADLTVVRDHKGKPKTDKFGDVEWAGPLDLVYRVLVSENGGASWSVTGNVIQGSPNRLFGGGKPEDMLGAGQGGYNLCVGVSPFSPQVVAVGLRNAALSTDHGQSWTVLDSVHLHSDVHGLVFDQIDPMHKKLFICSDGGLCSTPDFGKTFASGANRQFPNFQFNRFAASPVDEGLVGGSLQDNGNVYAAQYVNVDPWSDQDGGDGVLTMFTQGGHLVRCNNDDGWGDKARVLTWDDSKRVFNPVKLLPDEPLSSNGVIPVDLTGDGLFITDDTPVEVVEKPAWANGQGHLMLAVAVTTETVYGLFGSGPKHFVWNQLTTIPHEPDIDPKTGKEVPYSATAVGSFDGSAIWVGMSNGRIFRLNAPDWAATDLTIPGNTNKVHRFAIVSDAPVFAIGGKRISRFDGAAWADVSPTAPAAPTSDLSALTCDRSNPYRNLFLSSDAQVWSSSDDGASWLDVTHGLPLATQIKDLTYSTESSGASFLYVATYGWSVYRRLLNMDEVSQTVTVTGAMGITDQQQWPLKDIVGIRAIHHVLKIGPLHPKETVDQIENVGHEVQVALHIDFEWRVDDSVVVSYYVNLVARDEDNAVDDHGTGTFTVAWSASHQQVIKLRSRGELNPDHAEITFNVAYP